MPTGYTAAIADGISFNDFVMNCARAMGACITMRDEPSGTPIPEQFEPSDYHQEQQEEAAVRILELEAMSDDEASAEATKQYEEEFTRWETRIAEIRELRGRYGEMLRQVLAWTPPTEIHNGLKKFMTDQIKQSIDWDCDDSYYVKNPPVLMTGSEWRDKACADAKANYEYHSVHYAEEVERVADRNAWVAALRQSLK